MEVSVLPATLVPVYSKPKPIKTFNSSSLISVPSAEKAFIKALKKIRKLGMMAGIALDLDTSVETIKSYKGITLIQNKRKKYNGGSRNVGIDYALEKDFDYIEVGSFDLKKKDIIKLA